MTGLQVQERPLSLAERAEQTIGGAVVGAAPPLALALGGADVINSFAQTHPQAAQSFMQGATSSPFGSIFGLIPGGNLLQGIYQMLQSLMSEPQGAGGDDEQYFQNANGGSVGDPHLSFDGQHWDNMGSQSDLLHSDSFDGGYQLSTQATAPKANGVTYNQSATVATNYGSTTVTLDKDGNATISQYGKSFLLSPGESLDLGNGQFVQRDRDGSLQMTCNNGAGGTITTTMRENGSGVDVNATADNVDLGGALVNGPNGTLISLPPHFRPVQPPHHLPRWQPRAPVATY